MTRLGAAIAVALFVSGCATVSKEKGHKEVADLVEGRSGAKTHWEQGSPEAEEIGQRVAALLGAGLNRGRAIGIALINNPSLQATYEELGVSQADMVQAGLLSNPTLGLDLGWTSGGTLAEVEGSLVQNFLDVFVLPLRKRIAKQQFTADTLRVAHEALAVVSEVRKELVEVQTTVQLVELERMYLQAVQISTDLAERQFRAGNITQLEVASQRATFQQAKLRLAQEELSLIEHREKLNRLLGLWGTQTDWKLAEKLPEIPAREPSLEHLESRAIRQRLDVDAARKNALLMGNATSVARTSRLFGVVEVGVDVHQDPDGPRVFGPTLTLELPVFDQRQAVIAKLEAQTRQAERQLMALSVDARSEVRIARAQLLNARTVVEHFRSALLPLREEVVEQAQLQYNGMQIGLYQLLEAKQEQQEAYRGYLEALGSYWASRAELERAVGGRIGDENASTPVQESPR